MPGIKPPPSVDDEGGMTKPGRIAPLPPESEDERPATDRRWDPFIVVTLAGIASAFLPYGVVAVSEMAWSLTCLGASVVALSWARKHENDLFALAGALAYVAFVALLVQAEGGSSKSGVFTLCLLAILWIGLYGRLWQAIVVTAASTVALVWLAVVEHDGGAVIARRGFFWLVIMTGVTIAVHGLRTRDEEALAQRDITIAQADVLATTLQDLIKRRDPHEALVAATRVGAQLTSAAKVGIRRCTYFVVDGTTIRPEAEYDESGFTVQAPWPLSDHPFFAQVVENLQPVSARLDPAVLTGAPREAVLASGTTHGAWYPSFTGANCTGFWP